VGCEVSEVDNDLEVKFVNLLDHRIKT